MQPEGLTLESAPTNLKRAEAASLLRIHVRTLDRRIADKTIMVTRVGRRVLIPKAQLQKLLLP